MYMKINDAITTVVIFNFPFIPLILSSKIPKIFFLIKFFISIKVYMKIFGEAKKGSYITNKNICQKEKEDPQDQHHVIV